MLYVSTISVAQHRLNILSYFCINTYDGEEKKSIYHHESHPHII